MKISVIFITLVLLSGPIDAKESPGAIRRKWTRHVSPNHIKEGMPRSEAERLLSARLIASRDDEGSAYYELDSEYLVCVHYRNGKVSGGSTLIPNSQRFRDNLLIWAAR
jgi:hypothetical protein